MEWFVEVGVDVFDDAPHALLEARSLVGAGGASGVMGFGRGWGFVVDHGHAPGVKGVQIIPSMALTSLAEFAVPLLKLSA